MTRFLVVGGRGFIGRSVLDALTATDPVVGTTRKYVAGLEHVEVADPADLHQALDRVRPDVVINAAGLLAGTQHDLWSANVTLVERLVDEVGTRGLRLVHTGSAAEIGDPGTTKPVTEAVSCSPTSDYGRSKLAGTEVVCAARRDGLDATVARVFNTVGPSTHTAQPIGEVMRRIRHLPPGDGPLVVGNAEVVRDFVDVTFAAAAIVAIARTAPAPPLINVCSGEGHAVAELVRAMLLAHGRQGEVHDLSEPAIACVIGDPSLLAEVTGLRASRSISDLARATLVPAAARAD